MFNREPYHISRREKPASWGLAPVIAALLFGLVLVGAYLSSHIQKLQDTHAAAEAFVEDRTSTASNIRLLSAAEKRALRTNPNRDHVARARMLGVNRPANREAAMALAADPEGPLRKIETDERMVVSPHMRYGIPYVTPDTHNTITLIAERFQRQLDALGLPPHRILITSVLRTTEDQERLRQVNANAARNVSAHEFGTTADIHYERFSYVPELDDLQTPDGIYEDLYRELVLEKMNEFASSYQVQLKALLGRVMKNLHDEGKLMVTMEHNQPVFHFTIDDELTDTQLADLIEPDEASPGSPG